MSSMTEIDRQLDDERGSQSRPTVHTHRAAELLDDLSNDEESQSEPVVVRRGGDALERLEDSLLLRGFDAHPAVCDLQADDTARVGGGDPNMDRPSFAVLDRVADQVGDDLIQAGTIPAADHRRAGQREG